MADSSQRREIDAFFNFFATFDLTRPATTVADLADGAALFEVLSVVYVCLGTASDRRSLLSATKTTFDNHPALPLNLQRIGFYASVRSNAYTA